MSTEQEFPYDTPYGVDESIERLICRRLDGEISPAQEAELERALAADSAARALLEEYRRNDLLAARALRADLGRRHVQPARRLRHPLWFVAAGAVLTAAAVVAISFLPLFSPSGRRVADNPQRPEHTMKAPVTAPRFIDYRQMEYHPRQRFSDVHRDLIGIRGRNPNVIYLFERQTQSTKVVPISGDF